MCTKSDKIDYRSFKYLFLDRDGVINIERPKDYVKQISEFTFIEGAVQAVAQLSNLFDKIFVITNQRGIGRGLFSEKDLADVHNYMIQNIVEEGGQIDQIYYCTDTKSSSINRKPNIGMAFQAKRDYPQIDFNESIFVGNSRSDIIFGNKLEMYSVLVGEKYPLNDDIYQISNAYYENLAKFAEAVYCSRQIRH